ncbi:CDP-alcohol phosphatidyltransferase family protein [Serratia plymuthica]|uniref:CDP-alcohol phosphatidyltransferase family protein n=1 Tax=Serratia TaxID=613 RepID=UPI00192758CC|nr:CDP-alcohol phosphatidyltransferase family protein [Serratia plymuthica]MBL3525244.1 CDP-alcohol phosphatidyltransferase family protein [Serratia plymuthica]
MMSKRRYWLMPGKYIDGANLVTATNVLAGIVALMLVLAHRAEWAILLVFIAILLDHLDGYLARRFYAHQQEKRAFGKQFDTLADMLNFNVVTAVLLFQQFAYTPLLTGVISASIVLFGCVRLSHFTLQTGSGDESAYGLQTPYAAFIIINMLLLNTAGYLPGGLVLLITAIISILQITCVPIRMPNATFCVTALSVLFFINLLLCGFPN